MVGLMDENVQIPNIEIGERIEVNGHRGTVLYTGSVPPTKGIWLGIDWDDPNRGKHDGTYNGVQYFKARFQTSGSLARREKVATGQSVISAIKQRYGEDNKILDSSIVEEVQRAINAPFLEMVGFDKVAEKQNNFESLTVVSVREHKVKSAGEYGKLEEICPNISELDLAQNLIKSWKDVADICSQLNDLIILDLSENRISYGGDVDTLEYAFQKLEYLILSKMEYTWEDVLHCAIMWPRIQKLQISFNKITTLSEPPVNIFENLKLLSLEGNNIMSWAEIQKLGSLSQLEVLNVSNTGITKVTFPSPNPFFPSLVFLLLSGNYINNWESISELEKLPCLTELTFRNNPVLEGITRATARQIIIARVSKLKILNAQEIPDDERRGAEYDYLKNNGRMWLESTSDKKDRELFLVLHPRYPDLVRKYGEMDESAFEVKSSALKTRLVNLKLIRDGKVISKRLPDGMTVQRLGGLVQKLFSTGSSPVQLTLKCNKNPSMQIPLENGLKALSYYSVEEGDIILVTT